MSEASRIRAAVVHSQNLGHVSDELAALVVRAASRKACRQMADDIAQTVLLGLVKRLDAIRPDTADSYLYGAVSKVWRNMLRTRRSERRYVIGVMYQMLDEVPPAARAVHMRHGHVKLRLKYY